MKRLFYSLLPCIHFISLCKGQVNTFEHVMLHTFAEQGRDWHALTESDGKNYLFCRVTGDSLVVTDSIAGVSYFELIKMDRQGQIVWSKRIRQGTPGYDVTHNTISPATNGDLLAGTSIFAGPANRGLLLLKTDSMGSLKWSKQLPGEGRSKVTCLLTDRDSNHLGCGYTWSAANIYYGYVFKTDSSGNLLWGKKTLIPGDTGAVFQSCREIPGEGYILTGYSSSYKTIALKIDYNGNPIWDREIITDQNIFYDMDVMSDGSIVFCGTTLDTSVTYRRLMFVKLSADGNLLWAKKLQPLTGPPYYGFFAWSVEALPSGGFAFGAYNSNTIPATLIGTMDAAGNLSWVKDYHAHFHTFDGAYSSLIRTSDGGYALYVAPSGTFTNGQATYSSAFLKMDANGGTDCEGISTSISLQNFIPGIDSVLSVSSCSTASSDYAISITDISILDSTICENIQDPAPTGIRAVNTGSTEVFTIYPNPTEGAVSINFTMDQIPRALYFEIADLTGKTVIRKPIENAQTGDNVWSFDPGLMPGIYFCSFVSDGHRHTQKIVIGN